MVPEYMKIFKYSCIVGSVFLLTFGISVNVVFGHPFWVIYDLLVGLNGLYFAIAIL